MMCDRCNQKPASIFLTKVVNGQKTEMHLCKQCAEEGNDEFFKNLSVINILAGLTGGIPGAVSRMPQEEPTVVCPNCGFDLERFRREGRLGCEHCYEHFASALQPMMRKIHGSLQHTGKRPGVTAEGPKAQRAAQNNRLCELKDALKAAVKAEEYERAAGIRDEIRALETVEGGSGK
jgi:protein arginine kinase activator